MIFEPLKTYNLAGVWQVTVNNGKTYDLKIPGTLDECNIGNPDTEAFKSTPVADPLPDSFDIFLNDDVKPEEEENAAEPILTRYTRKYRYEDSAEIRRNITFRETEGKRIFLEVERARDLRLFVDKAPVPHFRPASFSTPQCFELTGLLNGTHEVLIRSDNSGIGLPKELLRSNMVSNDSQTDWNGLLGYVRLREENSAFVDTVLVRPEEDRISVYLEIASEEAGEHRLSLISDVLEEEFSQEITLSGHYTGLLIEDLKVRPDALRWNEGEGETAELDVILDDEGKKVRFGLRTMSSDERGHILLNGRPVFLRGETNMAVFPETAYAPMNELSWTTLFKKYLDYGANFVRFRSWCPPEAAFTAADSLGLLLMPELSAEGLSDGKPSEVPEYYRHELTRILLEYGSHPSFCMLSLGAGLTVTEENLPALRELLELAKKLDPTRLYAVGSGVCLPDDGLELPGDFLLTSDELQETFFSSVKKPVISLERGGYEILPDFHEIDLFSGFLEPANFQHLLENVQAKNLLGNWPAFVDASGRTAFDRTRDEIEKDYLDTRLSGVTVLGLQDFPGGGTGLFGMMNSHMITKSYDFAKPALYRSFFCPVLPILSFSHRSYEFDEELNAAFWFMNYGKEDITAEPVYKISGEGIALEGHFDEMLFPAGSLTSIGTIREKVSADGSDIPREITVTVRAGKYENRYSFYVYPERFPRCPQGVYETAVLDQEALIRLDNGEKVLIAPPAGGINPACSANTDRIPSESDSYGKGTRGMFIRKDHPLFKNFPTERNEDFRWHHLKDGRAVILPRSIRPIAAEMDNCREIRNLGWLFECRVLNGTVFFSALGLREKDDDPAARALLQCIYDYMDSFDFSPAESMRAEDLAKILKKD